MNKVLIILCLLIFPALGIGQQFGTGVGFGISNMTSFFAHERYDPAPQVSFSIVGLADWTIFKKSEISTEIGFVRNGYTVHILRFPEIEKATAKVRIYDILLTSSWKFRLAELKRNMVLHSKFGLYGMYHIASHWEYNNQEFARPIEWLENFDFGATIRSGLTFPFNRKIAFLELELRKGLINNAGNAISKKYLTSLSLIFGLLLS